MPFRVSFLLLFLLKMIETLCPLRYKLFAKEQVLIAFPNVLNFDIESVKNITFIN